MTNFKINTTRLWDSIMQMGTIGETKSGGCSRLALTELDKQARDLFIAWCVDAGCSITIDEIGNIYATRAGTDADLLPITTGSHLDTQPVGGKFDGIYGCLAGLEVVRCFNENNIATKRPIEIVIWTNEEGSRFAPAMIASAVYAGKMSLSDALKQKDNQGVSIDEALELIDYKGNFIVGSKKFHRFIELHIEQGPVLEHEQKDIGIVEGALGMCWYDVNIEGEPAHSGPTPMSYRKDALYASAKIISELIEMANQRESESARCTIGQLSISNPSRNVIPGSVKFSLDLRNASSSSLERMEENALNIISKIANFQNVKFNVEKIWDSPPVKFDEETIQLIENEVLKNGCEYIKMTSGAGHDAVNIASCTPTAMIFIPSVGGISHNEQEYSTPTQVALGAQILFSTMISAANL